MALCPEHIDILSLCTGGAGLDLGVELAIPSARTVCMVEREAFAVAHLVSAMEQGLLHPAPIWSDARTFDGRAWRGCVDGLVGGIPCQPHSLAGKRLGEGDERDLWSTARRIIVQSGCWFVLIENVGGMLSSGGAERVWRDLRRLGFEVEGGLFTAKEVGASHERERFFLLGVADAGRLCLERWRTAGDLVVAASARKIQGQKRQRHGPAAGNGGEVVADAGRARRPEGTEDVRRRQYQLAGGGQDLEHSKGLRWREGWAETGVRGGRNAIGGADTAMAHAAIERVGPVSIRSRRQVKADTHADRPGLFPPGPTDIEAWRNVLGRAPQLEPAVRRMADGVAARVDRLRMLGNGVVSLEAAYALRTLATRLAGQGSAGAAVLIRVMESSIAA
ncbi:mlr7992 [Mesorhizobium japonicum MAFF 303099]|uniref:Mlr7992 protein n=1 Tax=Mesorhizobium japonicum (strain LMG 29417 / CECT 9101 / MAFF 303099) TaxID=266835 RepID=Q984I4_RHILO|nr:mlr7992 [Mesorhizobium japonicum MAFF 303099]